MKYNNFQSFLLMAYLLACCSNKKSNNTSYDSDAYIGVNIIDGTGTGSQDDMTIIIKNGKIIEIGKRNNTYIGENTRTVDAQGKWVIPGLIDMHAHVTVLQVDSNFTTMDKYDKAASLDALKTMLAFGITTVRNPAGPTSDAIELRNLVNNHSIIGPTIFTAGYALNRVKSNFGPFAATTTESEIRNEVRSQISQGVDFIKVYGSLEHTQIQIAIDEAHKHGKKVIGHLQNTSWTDAANLGIDFISHAAPWNMEYLPKHLQVGYRPSFLGRLFWLENVNYSDTPIKNMISSLVRNKVSVDPTLIVFHSKFWGDDKKYTESEYLNLAPELSVSIWNKVTFTSNWTPEDYKRAKKQWNKLVKLTKLMHESGVLITAGSDFPNPWVIPGISLHQELQLLSEAGISNNEILKIATLNGAKSLGIDEITGSIKVGKEADMIFLHLNPLENIENTRSIYFLLNNGTYYKPTDLNKHIPIHK